MEVDPLASENKIRARRYRETAGALEKAARAYLQAAEALVRLAPAAASSP